MEFQSQPGMWAATGTAIAHAPTLTELREPVAGGENVEFNEHGHSAQTVTTDEKGAPMLPTTLSRLDTILEAEGSRGEREKRPTLERQQTLLEKPHSDEKHTWTRTLLNGFKAFYKLASTPTGFLMTLYGLHIVAWGAMLFFLLLDAAPAMDHPNKDSNESPMKIWLEIDSQILNALFCVTGFGLAPWRFRDLWWLYQARLKHNRNAMERLEEQNRAWFRPPTWFENEDVEKGNGGNGEDDVEEEMKKRVTFTGEVAPPTRIWKLAGVMMWWEGRKVKKIEGPMVVVVERKRHRPLL